MNWNIENVVIIESIEIVTAFVLFYHLFHFIIVFELQIIIIVNLRTHLVIYMPVRITHAFVWVYWKLNCQNKSSQLCHMNL